MGIPYAELDVQPTARSSAFRADAFFGKPLATCVRMVLDARQQSNLGAVSQEDLYAALIAGGFDFEDKSEELSKRNLAISLGKNMLFQRTPNGFWGLRDWYGVNGKGKMKAGPSSVTGSGKVTSSASVAAAGEANENSLEET